MVATLDLSYALIVASFSGLGLWILSRGNLLRNDDPEPRNHEGIMNQFVIITNVLLTLVGCFGGFFLLTGAELIGLLILLIGLVIYVLRWSIGIRYL